MRKAEIDFPTFTLGELIFSKNDDEACEKEEFILDLDKRMFLSRSFYFHKENVDEKIRFRYKLSGCLIDPNRFRFRKVVRILALVLTFIRKRSKEIDGVLYYVGRIPPDYGFDGYPELCEAVIDLCRTTFCVPVMDQWSPVAISIAMEIHWYHPDVQHCGIEAKV